MKDFFYLIPISIALGLAGLGLFLWSLKNGQYEDLDGASERILYDDDRPSKEPGEFPLVLDGCLPDRSLSER